MAGRRLDVVCCLPGDGGTELNRTQKTVWLCGLLIYLWVVLWLTPKIMPLGDPESATSPAVDFDIIAAVIIAALCGWASYMTRTRRPLN